MDLLLLIVIGTVLAVLLTVILVITVIVRQKKSKRKYDMEKAQGNTDKSKKLNEKTEEKILTS